MRISDILNKSWKYITRLTTFNVLNKLIAFLRLQTIIVDHPSLESVRDLVHFILLDIVWILIIALMVTLSWVGVFFTGFPAAMAVTTTFLYLTYIARRWYLVPNGAARRIYLNKLRLAKLTSSCIGIIFCLLTFFALSVHSASGSERIYKAFHSMFEYLWSPQITKKDQLLVRNAQLVISTMFLISLESVLITDIVSSVKHMACDTRFRIALDFEAPVLLFGLIRMGCGIILFNVINAAHTNRALELALIALVLVWIGMNVIDVGLFQTDNPTLRSIDLFGYKKMEEICWHQIDVNVVAYSLMILFYSQWKTATTIMGIDSEPPTPPEQGKMDYEQLLESFEVQSPYCGRFDRPDADGSNSTSTSLQLTCEFFFIMLLSGISLRFKKNFENSYKYSNIMRTMPWTWENTSYEISSRTRFSREFYNRDVPFRYLLSSDVSVDRILAEGVDFDPNQIEMLRIVNGN